MCIFVCTDIHSVLIYVQGQPVYEGAPQVYSQSKSITVHIYAALVYKYRLGFLIQLNRSPPSPQIQLKDGLMVGDPSSKRNVEKWKGKLEEDPMDDKNY